MFYWISFQHLNTKFIKEMSCNRFPYRFTEKAQWLHRFKHLDSDHALLQAVCFRQICRHVSGYHFTLTPVNSTGTSFYKTVVIALYCYKTNYDVLKRHYFIIIKYLRLLVLLMISILCTRMLNSIQWIDKYFSIARV